MSLLITITTYQNGNFTSRFEVYINIKLVMSNALSAIGSKIFPKYVILFSFLAKNPSNASVIPAIMKTKSA
jgi:hypothetical protein